MADNKLARVKSCVRLHADFPKPGVGFRDIFPVLANPSVFKDLTDLLESAARESAPDVIVGLEARGFLFGPILAQSLNVPFVPLRKKGKLPGEVISFSYQLEYGSDVIEIQKGSVKPGQKVLIVDDLIATGGTMKAGCDLVEKAGGIVCLCLVIIELNFLKGRNIIDKPLKSLIAYDD